MLLFLQPVVIDKEAAPNFFNIFVGELHPSKKSCFNAMMKDWTLNGDTLLKFTRLKKYECTCTKPSTFIARIKGLSSELQAHNTHFNVESGLKIK